MKKKINLKNSKFKLNTKVPVDEFCENFLYNEASGYYTNQIEFGKKGDFITSPTISNLFSEIIGIWIISAWENIGEPKKFNIVELGPGDGSLVSILIKVFKKFPKFYNSSKIYLYEKSKLLKKKQKVKLKNENIKWISSFNKIQSGPIIFFGNEFFDAIPVKQILRNKNQFKEKCYLINKNGLKETFKKASSKDISKIKSFKILKNLNFIEYPKLGFKELNKITKKISSLTGGILLIDYGYLDAINKSTLQMVKNNKKINIKTIYKNFGKADITSLVNFKLMKEYFEKNRLKVKNIVSQKFFLERMGIIERAKILEKKMTTKEKMDMSNTLVRLLHKKIMGELFKVIFAYKSKQNNFLGFN